MIVLLAVGIPAILITSAALGGAIVTGFNKGYDIPALTAAYHQRRAEGDSLAVMTADEPDGVVS